MKKPIWIQKFFRKNVETSFVVEIYAPPFAEVTLVSHSDFGEQLLAKVCDCYKGRLDNEPRLDWEVAAAVDDMMKTKLKTPLEMLHFTFLIRGVTRAFTHQLVRYRVGTSFAQESMRFYGAKDVYRVLATGDVVAHHCDDYGKRVAETIILYENMIDEGVPSEDARGILPTNILTNIFFDCNLLTFQNIFNQRVCCQAQQGEWGPLLIKMRKIIEGEYPLIKGLITAPVERGEPCGYNATFDRKCVWKNGIP